MTLLQLEENQIVTPISRDDLIDALSPGRVAAFLDRFPSREHKFYLTPDGRVIQATSDGAATQPVAEPELYLVARRARRRLDLRT